MWTITYDHHTHTTFSHGKGSIEDNVREAIRKGLTSVGITDHGPGHLTYGVKRENIPVMRREVDRLNKVYRDIDILLGVEANIWEPYPHIDLTDEDKKYLDYVIAGYHYGVHGGYCIKNYTYDHGLKFGGEALKKKNTEMTVAAIMENDIYILTHPGDKGPFDMEAISMVCEQRGVLMEINAKHPHLTLEELAIAQKYDVNFIVSSDAHVPQNVGNVAAPLARAKEAGVPLERLVNVVDVAGTPSKDRE